jgi:hypothetical protein
MAFPSSTVLNWVHDTTLIGPQPIMQSSTTQQHPIGTIVRAKDNGTANLGSAEFQYIKATATVAAGQAVSFDLTVPSAELLVDDGRIGQVGIAVCAIASGSYGWVQVSGAAVAKYLTNAAINLLAYVTATAGSVSSDIVSGDAITGANFKTAADLAGTSTATGYGTLQLSRPFVATV